MSGTRTLANSVKVVSSLPSQALSGARRGAVRRRLGGVGMPLASLAVGAAVWEIASRVWQIPAFPPLSTIVARVAEMAQHEGLLSDVRSSFENLLVGFAMAAVLGLVVGTAMGLWDWLEDALDVYVNGLLTAPSLVFAPILFSIFGLGDASIIAVIVLFSTFIIMVNTATAMKSVPVALHEMAASFGARRHQILLRVVLPCAVPLVFAGLRLGVGRAVKGMVNGEMFISVVGLGAVITSAGHSSDAASVLAVLLVVIVMAYVAVASVEALDRRLTRWLPDSRQRE